MAPFHVSLHAAPRPMFATENVQLQNVPWVRLIVSPEQLQQPLQVTFEEASQRLNQLPRMFLEPDGSFVWVGESESPGAWQIDGLLIDRGGRLQTVELKGTCPVAAWDHLASCFQACPAELIVQLIQPALFVSEPEFRRHLLGG